MMNTEASDHNSFYAYAAIYDEIHRPSVTDFAERLKDWLRKANKSVTSLLDCGCGTGLMLEMLHEPGMICHGVDISAAMIKIAQSRSKAARFINASMLDCKTDFSHDLIICVNDALNYLQPAEWSIFFKKIKQILNRNGIFYFDYDTYYDFASVWNGHDEITLSESWMCYKSHEFDHATRRGVEHQTWFIKQASNLYKRFSEDHFLYAVEDHLIEIMLKEVGLKIVSVIDPATFLTINNSEPALRKGMMVEHE